MGTKFLKQLPAIHGFTPPPPPGIEATPTTWQGLPVQWIGARLPELVFIEHFELHHAISDSAITALLYGRRFELDKVLVHGKPFGKGYFIEYIVHEFRGRDGLAIHCLNQHESITYSAIAEESDYISATRLRERKDLAYNKMPSWNWEEAEWPTLRQEPMTFLGGVRLEENELTRSYLTWRVKVFLFFKESHGRMHFKCVEQEIGHQSAADHYSLEERRKHSGSR